MHTATIPTPATGYTDAHRQSTRSRVPFARAAYVEPMYRAWAGELTRAAGVELLDEIDAPAFVFDGPGTGALRYLLGRSWSQNQRTAVYTLHASEVWHAVIDATGAHLATWPTGHRGLGAVLERAAFGDVRVPRQSPLTRMQANVVGYLLLGWSTERIAEALGIHAKTLNAHVSAVLTTIRPGAPGRPSRGALIAQVLGHYYRGDEA